MSNMKSNGKRRDDPYTKTSNWIAGKLAFWLNEDGSAKAGYNVEAYEKLKAGWIKRERKFQNL